MKRFPSAIDVSDAPLSERDIYDCVKDIAIEEIASLFDKMIASADTFDGWVLSVKDSNRLVKILNSKKRIIKSSFTFQLKKNLSDFKSIPKTRFDQNLDRDRYSLKLAGIDPDTERQELESIIRSFEETHSDFYDLVTQRLQHCINRSRVRSTENPLHVKRLFEAFRYSLDNFNLESKFQIALYRLFAYFVVNGLSSTYQKVDNFLIENNVLPYLQLIKEQPESLETTAEIELPEVVISDSPDIQSLVFNYCDGRDMNDSIFAGLTQRLTESGVVLQQQTLEYLDSLFSSFFDEEHLPEKIKQQLGRLQGYLFLYAIENSASPFQALESACTRVTAIVNREVDRFQQDIDPELSRKFLKQTIDEANIEQSINVDEFCLKYLAHIESNDRLKRTTSVYKPPLSIPDKAKAENPPLESTETVNAASIVEPKVSDQLAIQGQSNHGDETESLDTEDIDHAANLRKGDWVEIRQLDASKMAKLVWKSEDCSLLIFVDNTGNRIREIDGSQFNKELELGYIRRITDSSVISNNTHFSVIQKFMGRLTPWSKR